MIKNKWIQLALVLSIATLSMASVQSGWSQDLWEEDDGKNSPQPVPTSTTTPSPAPDSDVECWFLDEKGCAEFGGQFYSDKSLCCFE